MDFEYIYLSRDNTVDLKLKADGVAVNLSAVTKITVTFGTLKIESTSSTDGPIRWSGVDFETGEIRLHLGGQPIKKGRYQVAIVVYDQTNQEGVHWSVAAHVPCVPIVVLEDLEGA